MLTPLMSKLLFSYIILLIYFKTRYKIKARINYKIEVLKHFLQILKI